MNRSIALHSQRRPNRNRSRTNATRGGRLNHATGDPAEVWGRLAEIVWHGKARRPRFGGSDTSWQTLVTLGTEGAARILLNDGLSGADIPSGKALTAWRQLPDGPFMTELIKEPRRKAWGVRKGTSALLRAAYKQGGWPGFQMVLLWHPDLSLPPTPLHYQVLWRAAFTEALAFAQAGFVVAWCDHGAHWYVAGDARQRDCPPHNKAGEMHRFRVKKRRLEREAARRETLRHHAATGRRR
jgi:hypothetical protein